MRSIVAIVLLSFNMTAEAADKKLETMRKDMAGLIHRLDPELGRLKAALSDPAGKARRAQCTNNLKQIALGIHNQAEASQNLVGKLKNGKAAADAAAALALSAAELAREAEAFPKSPGPGDAEALARLSKAVKKAVAKHQYMEIRFKEVLISSNY